MNRKKNKGKKHKPSSVRKKSQNRVVANNIKSTSTIDRVATDSEVAKAIQYHQSGQLQKAEEIYKKILRINPNHPDSLHLLGVLAYQVGKIDIAVTLISKAIQNNPNNPGKLQAIRQKLAKNLTTEPLFDTPRFARNLEKAYKEMWKIFIAGESPRQIEVVES